MGYLIPTKRSSASIHPFDELFQRFFDEPASASVDAKLAPAEVSDDDRSIYVTIEVPGLSRDDVSIHYRDGVLTVSGEKKVETSDDKKGVYLKEIRYGKFSRSLRVGDVDFDSAQAKLDHGQLRITLPKSKEVQARKLNIQ